MDDQFLWEDKPELNITPLVDIMLVLLAILMVTTPTIVYQEDITLPKGSKSAKKTQNNMLEIRIDKRKKIYIKNNTYEYKMFPDSFNLLAKQYSKKDTSIFIRADKDLSYESVIYILKSVKEAGFNKISLVTNG
ncbi:MULTISPECIES: ExbD/TolR family protein [Helicobacter]|uniref:ExbD/TolR family biopolymer transport protein n=2 Tax=Helicobacter TaxID=209 RepID=A0A377J4N4_9HELI|nr:MULTISPECIES: ExbD/TolR family protein [Helicobacter]MDL0079753.1 ExbD/TolR family protein [Helicobacter sp. CPD2-1]MDL0082152.1 ExbD/TolR family protein [Helicobacter sp. XJK30-2]STO97255.1 ExbD/TolR family biopolymer transport protein [Helicobacter canis]